MKSVRESLRTSSLRAPTKGRKLDGFRILQRADEIAALEAGMDPVEIAKQILRVHGKMAASRLPVGTPDYELITPENFDAAGALEALRNGTDTNAILKFASQLNALVPNAKLDKSELEKPPLARQNRLRLEELAKKSVK